MYYTERKPKNKEQKMGEALERGWVLTLNSLTIIIKFNHFGALYQQNTGDTILKTLQFCLLNQNMTVLSISVAVKRRSLMRVKPKRVSCPTESEGSFMFRAKVKRMSTTMQEPAKETLKIASLAEGHKTASNLVT